MGFLINGKDIAKDILKKTALKVRELKKKGIVPKLAVVLVGNDMASKTYVDKKGKAAEKIGMNFELHKYPADISQKKLEKEIKNIQKESMPSGLIIQLPVPENFYPTILNVIDPKIDVDCLTHDNLGKLFMKTNKIIPPTPGAVMSILNFIGIDLKGKKVCLVGAGVLVGKPLSIILMNIEATVIICNAFTKNIKQYTLDADIIVSGVGKKHIITADMVKEGTVVIDAGVDFENNQMFGDVDFENVKEKASFITPTPGGVGPITVANLLWNTVVLAEINNN